MPTRVGHRLLNDAQSGQVDGGREVAERSDVEPKVGPRAEPIANRCLESAIIEN